MSHLPGRRRRVDLPARRGREPESPLRPVRSAVGGGRVWSAVAVIGALFVVAVLPRAVATKTALPEEHLPQWRQVVAEDFDTAVPLGSFASSPYSSGLLAYDNFADTFGHGVYSPDRVLSVQNGSLDWFVHNEDGANRVGAVVVKNPETGWGQTYARYSVRFRSDVVEGYKLAFLLWPDSDDWGEGEIDFPEAHTLERDSEIVANVYRPGTSGQPGPSSGLSSGVSVADSGWHVATVEWAATGVTFVLDDVVLGVKSTDMPKTPMHLVLQVETAQTAPSPNDSGHVQVDWVTLSVPA